MPHLATLPFKAPGLWRPLILWEVSGAQMSSRGTAHQDKWSHGWSQSVLLSQALATLKSAQLSNTFVEFRCMTIL